MNRPLLFFVGASLLSFGLGWLVWSVLLRWRVIDLPNARSSHQQPTVRGGGLGILAVLLFAGSAIAWWQQSTVLVVLLMCGSGLGAISFRDDLRSVPQLVRLLCQAICAGAAVAAAGAGVLTGNGLPSGLGLVKVFGAALLLLIWVTGYTNAFNFMDGINGIAAGQATVTGLGMAGLALLVGAQPTDPPVLFSAVAAGAAAGFLPHNFPRARMFMGDVGSATLGYWLSAATVWLAARHGWEFLIPLVLLHANFILDTAVTLVRRMVTGQRWYDAHREHFYQRLIRAGKSHPFVTLWELGLQLVTLGLMIVYVLTTGWLARGLLAGGVVLIWSVFFLYSELEFRKAPVRAALQRETAVDSAQVHR